MDFTYIVNALIGDFGWILRMIIDNVGSIISVFIGGILTILTTLFVENLRRPKLSLSCEDAIQHRHANENFWVLRVRVSNSALPRYLSWMLRATAVQCRGIIWFLEAEGPERGRPIAEAMEARWSDALEPRPLEIVGAGKSMFIHDPARAMSGIRMDIQPGESEPLDIAVRFENDKEFYGWNNEAYFSKNGRTESWKIDRKTVLVQVSIASAGQVYHRKLRLVNGESIKSFWLEDAGEKNITLVNRPSQFDREYDKKTKEWPRPQSRQNRGRRALDAAVQMPPVSSSEEPPSGAARDQSVSRPTQN
jgi:hypothetical protein